MGFIKKSKLAVVLIIVWMINLYLPGALQVEAAASASLAVSTGAGTPGQEITITLSLKDCVNVAGMAASLLYDPAVLEPKSMTAASGLSLFNYHLQAPGTLRFNFITDEAIHASTLDVATCRFIIKPDAPSTISNIVIQGEICDMDENITILPESEGKITVKAIHWVYGDANWDGKFDTADYTLMRAFLLGKFSAFPNPEWRIYCDVTGEGKIDTADYMVMRQKLLTVIDQFPAERG